MRDTLYQHGTLGTLMAGLLEGTATIQDILDHGDSGLGTLEGSDGEVIFIDGQAFHANAQNEFTQLTGEELTPFATITHFQAHHTFHATHQSAQHVLDTVRSHMCSQNAFSAVKITGSFQHMHVRMMPGQTPPYRRLIESAQQQPEYTRTNITGTLIGFYTPELFHGIGAGGFHIHFVDDARTFGGHVLDFHIEEADVEIQDFETLAQHFPIDHRSFTEAHIDYENISEDIKEAE
ncbi:acetolactate decarboxylase [Staphylococcus intermedius]|uniref:acetolactate decarboxylase n=1 Tax=Staphylococcus intermedius TaxID=1285 RepID=UPI000BBBEBCA|nr:acetolactate decarboxylase [Staphylococcus intermedius]PCF87886.1 acetolactate decarboxylase [Staphylococcus intermedius]